MMTVMCLFLGFISLYNIRPYFYTKIKRNCEERSLGLHLFTVPEIELV